MGKKKKSNHSFWKRVRFKYRVSVINENTLEEIWKIRASIFWGVALFIIISSLVVAVTSVIIIATPIRYYLPGYLDSEVREQAIRSSIRIDSLEQQLSYKEAYSFNLKAILDGTSEPDSIATNMPDTISIPENDPALQKTERERDFVQKYGEEEKYNLSVLPFSSQPTENVAFFSPVKGLVNKKFDAVRKHYGVLVQTRAKETVSAVLDGTVVYSGFDAKDGYVIQLQHKNGFMSVYKNCSMLLKSAGEKVRTGEAIATLSNTGELPESYLYLEIWTKGTAVDPENYFSFK